MSIIVRGNLADDAVSVSVSLQLFTKKNTLALILRLERG
jgi:hypothetical protein